MTFETPEGTRANRIWQLPTSSANSRSVAGPLEAWACLHAGFMGRAPDHVASCISGIVMGLGVFEAFDPQRAAALAGYYRHARDRDLYLTYVIINPQADRSKECRPAAGHAPDRRVGRSGMRAGITVRGAKMLGDRRRHRGRGLRLLHPAAGAWAKSAMRCPLPFR